MQEWKQGVMYFCWDSRITQNKLSLVWNNIKLNYKQAHDLIQGAGTNIIVVNASSVNMSVLSKTLIPTPAY